MKWLLIDYVNKHQIILEMNDINNMYGQYPLEMAIIYNNTEIVQLLIDYALQHQIILEYNKDYYEIRDFKPKIRKLMEKYEKKKRQKV